MIYFHCQNEDCGFIARAKPGESEAEAAYLLGPQSEWYPNRYPCPHCGSLCEVASICPSNRRVIDLTVHEAFLAFNGVGLPEERECSSAAIEQLLRGAQIESVVVRHIPGSSRSCIDLLVLSGGTRVFLGASSFGACVYRVSGPNRYADQLSQNDLAAPSAAR